MRLKLRLLEKIPAFGKYFGDSEKPHYYSPVEIIGIAYKMGKDRQNIPSIFSPLTNACIAIRDTNVSDKQSAGEIQPAVIFESDVSSLVKSNDKEFLFCMQPHEYAGSDDEIEHYGNKLVAYQNSIESVKKFAAAAKALNLPVNIRVVRDDLNPRFSLAVSERKHKYYRALNNSIAGFNADVSLPDDYFKAKEIMRKKELPNKTHIFEAFACYTEDVEYPFFAPLEEFLSSYMWFNK